MNKIIDAHTHLDRYSMDTPREYFDTDDSIENVISVSIHLESCIQNHGLFLKDPRVKPAYGFHPEQELPSVLQLEELLGWMGNHQDSMVAIGEVGLPYYKRTAISDGFPEKEKYKELLETFIIQAKQWNKPIILHAIYDDAPIVCHLLEKHSIAKAHFHWFKGDIKTMERLAANGHCISITPDIVYKKKTQDLVSAFPLEQIMVETDGPWQFEGPFEKMKTHSSMIHQSVKIIARIKQLPMEETYVRIFENTTSFFSLAN